MSPLKKFSVLTASALALCAIGVASASASEFTAEAAGKLDGKALATQVFSIHNGEQKVTCSKITVTGEVIALKTTEQHVTIDYSECVAHTSVGTVTAHITPATYLFTANSTVHIKNTITVQVTVPFANCHITISSPQTLGVVAYSNNSGKIKITPSVTGINYTTTGGFCGGNGSDGTYTGASEVTLESGKKLTYDA
jgi:hypothetical protein